MKIKLVDGGWNNICTRNNYMKVFTLRIGLGTEKAGKWRENR